MLSVPEKFRGTRNGFTQNKVFHRNANLLQINLSRAVTNENRESNLEEV